MLVNEQMTLRAYAKINLALAVGPPEPPRGYHPIASWFTCIGLHDELRLERVEDRERAWTIAWAADAPRRSAIDWPIEKDLTVRAHRLLEQAAGRALRVRGTLSKRTPVGAGLGGGSADAAAAFVGINELFGLGFSRDALRGLSASLGSDIAFFIDDEEGTGAARPAMVTGFGERIERLLRAPGWVALVFPPFGCATGPVYRAFDSEGEVAGGPGPLREGAVRELTRGDGGSLKDAPLFNDLAAAACAVEPRLGEMLARLRGGLDGPVHVTGSGSTMFAPARDQADAERLAQEARELCPEAGSMATALL